MHKRHRSPYPSPSRSPRRSSKCQMDEWLRTTRRSIWPRAKHRVGLERPHFCTRFRAQSECLQHLLQLGMRISPGKRGNKRHEDEKSDTEKNTRLGGSDPTFWRSIRPKVLSGSLPPVAAFRCACFFAKGEAASLLAVKFSSSGEVGFTPLLHRNLTCYFTLDRARHYGNQSDESSRRTKLCAAQTAPEAGATPPFDARCVKVS